jgi:hypothetical protein
MRLRLTREILLDMDSRLRAAVDASLRWYADVFALHGLRTVDTASLWIALDPPPPYHSAVKTRVPGVPAASVLAAMERHPHGTVADSFGDLDLTGHGFTELFTATWLHRSPSRPSARLSLTPWSRVTGENDLLDWNAGHDTAQVLVPRILGDDRFRILARHQGGRLTGGMVLHDAGPTAGLSNAWSETGTEPVNGDEAVALAEREFPGRSVSDFASGPEAAALVRAGFIELGLQRVWIR